MLKKEEEMLLAVKERKEKVMLVIVIWLFLVSSILGWSFLGNFLSLRMWDCQIIMPHITMINAYEFCFLLFGWHVLLAI
jgi:hypothetical protein